MPEGPWIHTLSDDRHPAGRHTVIDGMMEVFGDRIAKISQIDRRAWIGGLPRSTAVVVVVEFSRGRYPVRRIGNQHPFRSRRVNVIRLTRHVRASQPSPTLNPDRTAVASSPLPRFHLEIRREAWNTTPARSHEILQADHQPAARARKGQYGSGVRE